MINHTFSISLKEKENLKNMSIGTEHDYKVEIEGEIGTLKEINFLDKVFEVKGDCGVLRIDLEKKEIEKFLRRR